MADDNNRPGAIGDGSVQNSAQALADDPSTSSASPPPGLIPEDMDRILAYIDQRVVERLAEPLEGLKAQDESFREHLSQVDGRIGSVPTLAELEALIDSRLDARIEAARSRRPTADAGVAQRLADVERHVQGLRRQFG